MAHNSKNDRMDFLYFFLNNVKNSSAAYKEYLLPILNEAKELANGSINMYQLTSESRDIKILLQEIAPEWLAKIDPSSIQDTEISELQEIIKNTEASLAF